MNLFRNLSAWKNVSGTRRRIPLFFRIFLSISSILVLLVFVLGGTFYDRYKDALYQSELEKGRLTLTHLSHTVKITILEEDFLKLSLLVSDYAQDEDISYVTIVDHNKNILADTDPSKVGEKYSLGSRQEAAINNSEGSFSKTLLASGEPNYELSLPLSFQEKFLGTVYLGLSKQGIDTFIDAKSVIFLKSLTLPLLTLLFLVFCLSILLTAWIKFPLYKILNAIQGICRGDFNFSLDLSGNNEFGDLASEVRQLSNNLRLKEQTRNDVADYLNCTVLDRILARPLTNGSSNASRRQVTILYAGIEGFGEYASHTKAEEVVEALNEYIGIATNTILEHGGYVDKFMGDAVVGIFGVSVYREDHTKRAVRAAWELQNVLQQGATSGNQLLKKVRIGMSSGVVLSGNIGSASRVEYSSIGESIKEAFWLTGLAAAKEIIISKSVYQLIKDVACVQALTPQKLIGHEGILESYRLQSIADPLQADLQAPL